MTNRKFTEFTPLEYLQIDIATSFGLDKQDWQNRIEWVQSNEADLESLVHLADEPALYFAGVQAYRKTQAGKPTGYPISLDAAASGLQLLSILSGCEASASLCGVVNTGHRADAYTLVYQAMCEKLGTSTTLDRAPVKQAIMTALYGSEAEPKKVFGEGTPLLECFYQTMAERAPGAWFLNEAIKAMWDPNALTYTWVLPDGFHVNTPVMSTVTHTVGVLGQQVNVPLKMNLPSAEGKSLCPNIIHSIDGMVVREMVRRCSYDQKQIDEILSLKGNRNISRNRTKDHELLGLYLNAQRTGFLSVRILDFIDEWNVGNIPYHVIEGLIENLPKKPFKVLTIHDCFRVHPNYANDLRRQYNQVLSDLAKSDVLQDILSQVNKTPMQVNKISDISLQVLEADYALA